ncbi:MAG TPA: Ig-like domain-containing protein [bacterium]|nr:Ig-like domain-containing protein [bacterium]
MFRTIAVFLFALTIALVGGMACSSDDDGTLSESNAGPSPTDDDDDDDVGPVVDDDDDDDDTEDDDTIDDDTYEGEITSIWIEPDFIAEPRGTEIQYVANGWGAEGQEVHNVPVNWNVGDSSIAEIDENGLVTTLSNGYTLVTATLQENDQIAISGTLYVSGDVFVLDGTSGYVGVVDIYDDSVESNYFIQDLEATPTSLAIYNFHFLGIGYDTGTSGGVQNADLDPENHVLLDEIALPPNQFPQSLTTVDWMRVYLTQPDTDTLAVIGQQGANFGITGYIYCRDDDRPTDAVFFDPFLVATISRSDPDLNDYQDGALYFYTQANLLVNKVEIENENPFAVTVATDENNNVYYPVISSGKPGVSAPQLHLVTAGMSVEASIPINASPAVIAADKSNLIWIGDGDDPHVYVYNIDEDDWLFSPENPLVLTGAGSITAIEVSADRKEVYIGAANGRVYKYDIPAHEVSNTYSFGSQFLPIDIVIW